MGDKESLDHATQALGNAVHMPQETKLAAIFVGILSGLLLTMLMRLVAAQMG